MAALRDVAAQTAHRWAPAVFNGSLEVLAKAGRLHPWARAARRAVAIERDVPYHVAGGQALALDVYRPKAAREPLPALIYVHGGGFSFLSKGSHWPFALQHALDGWLVFVIDYRLASRAPFPAPLADVAAALAWVGRHGPRFGADGRGVALAGESAGANLVLATSLAASLGPAEPWAAPLADAPPLRAAVVACGPLDLHDPGRWIRARRMPAWARATLEQLPAQYVGESALDERHAWASPLRVLEGLEPRAREELPPIFGLCGTRDPLIDDTRRLAAALAPTGGPHEVRLYPGGVHAFHALPFSALGRRCWHDLGAWLAQR